MRRLKACDIIEIQFPDIADEQLASLIDFLAELLASERIREFYFEKGDDLL